MTFCLHFTGPYPNSLYIIISHNQLVEWMDTKIKIFICSPCMYDGTITAFFSKDYSSKYEECVKITSNKTQIYVILEFIML